MNLTPTEPGHTEAIPGEIITPEGEIEVDPQTFKVYADGELLHVEPATRVPLCRKYILS